MALSTPVALVFYHRPALLARVFEAVAAARPSRLFLIADGPRDEADRADCLAARQVVEQLSWPCQVQRFYAETNLGVKRRVSSGLEWVFDQVEEAIILEDDCLPGPSFFSYCQELLDRYRRDDRVFAIGGGNYQFGRKRSQHSYHFSGYCSIWGWATWKRAWRHYDVDIKDWPMLREHGLLEAGCNSAQEVHYWRWVFDNVYSGRIDTWDYQLLLAMWSQHALFVVPEANLVSNIGFGAGSTHTWSSASRLAAVPVNSIGALRHPSDVYRNAAADLYTFRRVLHGTRPLWLRRLVRALRGR